MTLTAEQLHILQHSLGCDKHGQSTTHSPATLIADWPYWRNRYVCDPDATMEALVAAGLMRDNGPLDLCGGMHWYSVTPAGRHAMRAQSPSPPVLTRSQQRYREWQDADCGLAFGEWLRAKATWEKEHGRVCA